MRTPHLTSRIPWRSAVASRAAALLSLACLLCIPAACSGDAKRESLARPSAADTAAESTRVPSSALAGGSSGADSAFFEFQVEAPVAEASGGAAPRYPEALRTSGVSGMVLVQFVVDTTGRAEPATFKVLKTNHDDFAAAVREALPGMRFTPARFEGRKVRQLVQQPFVFALER